MDKIMYNKEYLNNYCNNYNINLLKSYNSKKELVEVKT